MKHRMAVALLSLLGVLLATYLYLYKIGVVGTMVCGTGACELVQTSRWSRFFGIEVSLIGLLGYLSLLGISMVGLQPANLEKRWPDDWLAILSGGGLLFTGYLTWAELFKLHAICRWCVVSAAIITLIFVTSLLARRR